MWSKMIAIFFNMCLTYFNLCFTQSAMPCQSDDDDIQLPSDPDYILPPTDRRKCGAERVPFSDEDSISVSSPVEEMCTNLRRNFICPVEFQVTCPCTSRIPYYTSCTLYFDPR
jgi:hypothetical protein